MPLVMDTGKKRMVLTVDEEIRATVRLEAAKQGREMSDIMASLIKEHLAESLEEVRRRQGGKKGKGEK
jgi:GTP cyclohydrolase FolE2